MVGELTEEERASVLEAVEGRKKQLRTNLSDINTRKAALEAELVKLRDEGNKLTKMLEALEKQYPSEA